MDGPTPGTVVAGTEPAPPAALPAPGEASAPGLLTVEHVPRRARTRAQRLARRARIVALATVRSAARPVHGPSGTPVRGAWSGLRRWAAGGVFVLIVVATALGLIALALSQERPSWWKAVDGRDPAVVAVAERLENAVATILTQARPAGEDGDTARPWTVRVNSSDINAWLNARLRTWMENREDVEFAWPDSLQELHIDFQDGLILVGAKVSTAKRSEPDQRPGNYFSAAIAPRFKADGSLWMPAESVALGRLSVPASWMLSKPEDVTRTDRVPDELARMPETRQVLAAFAGREAVMLNPTIRLGDGRRVKLLAMTAYDGKLSVTCQTIVREPARADAGRD